MVDMYKIGDYISYTNEYYTGRGFRVTSNYGCIVSKSTHSRDYYEVIKQYGGKLWVGIKPTGKISEETFLEKFSVYDEYKEEVLKILDKLPLSLQEKIKKQCREDEINVIKKVFTYSLKNTLKNRGEKVTISPESWYIQWYVYNVLRRYEPFYINKTLTFCYGASELLKKFMEEYISFMIDMQFLGQDFDKYLIFLIEEKVLEYKLRIGNISEKYYMEHIVPIRIKKLEMNLDFKISTEDKKFKLQFEYLKKNYSVELESEKLLDTKFVLVDKRNKSYRINKYSKCKQTHIVNNPEWINDLKKKEGIIPKEIYYDSNTNTLKNQGGEIIYENVKGSGYMHTPIIGTKYAIIKNHNEVINLKTLKKVKINHKSTHASTQFSPSENLIYFINSYSNSSCYVKLVTVYCSSTGMRLGKFEFNTTEFEDVYDIEVDYV